MGFAVFSLGQAVLGHSPAQAGASSSDAAPARTWVVQPGQTLWSIAERLAPDTDPRETVARIVAMNDLPDAAVLVGQEIVVPA
jgi:Tfp pilus assembly protein FimV